MEERFNSLPHDKISYLPKSNAFANDKLRVFVLLKLCDYKKSNLFWAGKKTMWEKKKMLVTSIFFFSCNGFQNAFLLWVVKALNYGVNGYLPGLKKNSPVISEKLKFCNFRFQSIKGKDLYSSDSVDPRSGCILSAF